MTHGLFLRDGLGSSFEKSDHKFLSISSNRTYLLGKLSNFMRAFFLEKILDYSYLIFRNVGFQFCKTDKQGKFRLIGVLLSSI